jgi:phenylacetate-CoA ligase
MRRSFYRYILLPGFESWLKGRKTFRYWSELERTQWLSRPQLQECQRVLLRRLLLHTYAHCPYYQADWQKRGLDPHRLDSLQDFQHWPMINRETIRMNRPTMRSTAQGVRFLSKSTGGSSGNPLQFDLDLESHERRTAAMFRGYAWAGAAPGTKQLFLWGVPLGNRPWWARWKDAGYNVLQRRTVLNSFDFRGDRVPDFLARRQGAGRGHRDAVKQPRMSSR